MKILMTSTVHGSLDGVTVQQLEAGAEYDTVDSTQGARLARYQVDRGAAVLVALPGAAPEPKPRPRKRSTKAAK